jgi:hypothetical protein
LADPEQKELNELRERFLRENLALREFEHGLQERVCEPWNASLGKDKQWHISRKLNGQ